MKFYLLTLILCSYIVTTLTNYCFCYSMFLGSHSLQILTQIYITYHVIRYTIMLLVTMYCTLSYIVVTCGALEDINNGEVDITGIVFNFVATYTCSEGHQLDGDMQRTCLSTGAWSGSEPQCSRKCMLHSGIPSVCKNMHVCYLL